MKIQRIPIVSLLLALLLMVGNSCSDDNPYLSNEFGSKLETTKDYKLSTFSWKRMYGRFLIQRNISPFSFARIPIRL